MAKRFIEIIQTCGDKILIDADFVSAIAEHTLANGAFGWTNVFVKDLGVIETYEPCKEVIEKIQKGGAE